MMFQISFNFVNCLISKQLLQGTGGDNDVTEEWVWSCIKHKKLTPGSKS